MINKILNFVQKRLFFLIVAVILGGLLNVKLFGGYQFTPLICLVAALIMIYPSLVPLSFQSIGKIKKYKKLIGLSIVLNFVLAPIVAYIIGGIFLVNEPTLRLGLIVLALLPGGGMVTTWALKSRADMVVTIGIILVNLLLAITIVPFGISFAMNKLGLEKAPEISKSNLNFQKIATENKIKTNNVFDKNLNSDYVNKTEAESCIVEKTTKGKASCGLGDGEITPFKIALPIIFIVIFPLILALITQKLIIKFKGIAFFNKKKKKFGDFSNLGLLVVLFLLMSLENNKTIFEQANLVLSVAGALIIFYGLIFIVPYLLYRKVYFNAQGKALLWGSFLRYITLALGLAISLVFQDEKLSPIILVIVLSYLIQIPSSFIITKILRRAS